MPPQVDPLNWQSVIVDKDGHPSPLFLQQWQGLLSLPSLTTAAGVSGVLDVIGSTRGSLIYRGSSAWSALTPGAANTILKSAGAGADPAWATLSALIDTIGSTRGSIIYRGASGWVALTPGTAGKVLTANGTGADPSYATPATIQALLDSIGSTQGNVLYRGASAWAVLAPGTSGHVLTTGGGAANPAWAAASGGTTPTWNANDAWFSAINLHSDGRTITGLYTASQRGSIRGMSSHAAASGKFYFEFLVGLVGSTHFPIVGVGSATATLSSFPGNDANGWGIGCSGLSWFTNATTGQNTYAAGDIIGVAVDFTATTGSIKFLKNNAAQLADYTGLSLGTMFPMAGVGGSNTNESGTLRTTAAQCTYSPPAGYSNWD